MLENKFLDYMTEAKGIFSSHFNLPVSSIEIDYEDNNHIIFLVTGININTNEEKKAKVRIKKGV